MNNINGHGGGRRSAMASMDFYRRVPKDLTEVSYIMVACSILQYCTSMMHIYLMTRAVIGSADMSD